MSARDLKPRLDRAKATVSIPDAWRRLGLPDAPPDDRDRVVNSPFRQDRRASFSIYGQGRNFRDHGNDEHSGDVVDFVRFALNRPKADAIEAVLSWSGDTAPLGLHRPNFRPPLTVSLDPLPPKESKPVPPKPLPNISKLVPLTAERARAVAQSRKLPITSTTWPASVGYLAGDAEGREWTLCDAPGWPAPSYGGPRLPDTAFIAESRHLDRSEYSHGGKSHTWAGSFKGYPNGAWPVGISALGWHGYKWRLVLAVEGGPDYLAAFGLLAALKIDDVLPIAILSRGTKALHPQAAALLQGQTVHVIPHADTGAEFRNGLATAEAWAAHLFAPAGVSGVSAATLETLTRPDGTPAKDLADTLENGGVLRNRDRLPFLIPSQS